VTDQARVIPEKCVEFSEVTWVARLETMRAGGAIASLLIPGWVGVYSAQVIIKSVTHTHKRFLQSAVSLKELFCFT
jgi:hypothetical protein